MWPGTESRGLFSSVNGGRLDVSSADNCFCSVSWLPLHHLKLGIWAAREEGSSIAVEVGGSNDGYFRLFLLRSKCPPLVFSRAIELKS